MQTDLKKFSLYCAEHRLAETISLLKTLDGVQLLHVFEKRYKLMLDKKDRLKRVVRHEIAGVCSEPFMTELVHLLALKKIYGFQKVTAVQFSDIHHLPKYFV